MAVRDQQNFCCLTAQPPQACSSSLPWLATILVQAKSVNPIIEIQYSFSDHVVGAHSGRSYAEVLGTP